MSKRVLLATLLAGVFFSGCVDSDCDGGNCTENYGVNPDLVVSKAPLTAYCTVAVKGVGTVDMETDYIPNVTWCENGGAADEALKTQTVAARSYVYWKIKNNETVLDGTGDQVYTCSNRKPSTAQLNKMKEMTNDTSGIVLMYNNTIVCGFFVAGSTQEYLDEDCKFTGDSSSPGWKSHQAYVTYNWGKTGHKADGFTQTSLGYEKDYDGNRGCMGQNGSDCLAKKGWQWPDIIKFFYGADIEITQAEGSCVNPITNKCEIEIDKSGVIIDDDTPCFDRSTSSSWLTVDAGYNNHLYFSYTTDNAAETIGTWNFTVKRAGKYEVFAYIQSDVGAVSEKAPYVVRASGTEHSVALDLTGKSGWVSLGSFDFAIGGDQWVRLSDASGEKFTDNNGKRVIFDAIKLEDAPTCSDACTAGSKQCTGNGLQTCEMGANGCTEWSAAVTCGDNQICSENECIENKCENRCIFVGERECFGDGYHICQGINDSCSVWSDVIACDSGKSCTRGICHDGEASSCTDECTAGQTKCDGTGYLACGQFDSDSCLEWSDFIACASGQTCDGGICSGEAINPSACLTAIDGRNETILDDLDPCFTHRDSLNMSDMSSDFGYNGHLYYAFLRKDSQVDAMGIWNLNVTKSGKYSIYAYINADIGMVAPSIQYVVRASGNIYRPQILVSESASADERWVKVGEFDFTAGQEQYVQLWDIDPNMNEDDRYRVLFDAIKVVPYDSDETDPEPEPISEQEVITSSDDCSSNGVNQKSGFGGIATVLVAMSGLGLLYRRRSRKC